jgi:hypothetical protein
LATIVLTERNEPKKKVHPANFTEEEAFDVPDNLEPAWHAFVFGHDEDTDEFELVEQLASQGDAHALTIQSFEQDLEARVPQICRVP